MAKYTSSYTGAQIDAAIGRIPAGTTANTFLKWNGSASEWAAINEVPSISASDKDKYLHTNASTGALEWLAAGSGGNPLAVEKVFEGASTSGSVSITKLSDLQAKYSSLIIIGHHQYAGNYHTIAHVDLDTIEEEGTVTALTVGFGWDRAIPAYFFRSGDSASNYYVNWNGGENNNVAETFSVTLILGIPKDNE